MTPSLALLLDGILVAYALRVIQAVVCPFDAG